MLKKVLAALLAVVTVTTLVACDPRTTSSTPSTPAAPKEIKTVKLVTTWDPGVDISSDIKIFTEWGARTGLKFEVTVNPRDNHKEKVNILLASKEIPDMLKFFQDENSYNDYGAAFFEPLDSYIDAGKLPNLAGYLKKYPEIEARMRNLKDGKLYGFGIVQDFDYFPNLWYVRNDKLKSKGLDAANIKSLDNFKAACLALKEANGGNPITSMRLGYGTFSSNTAAYWGMPHTGIFYDSRSPEASKEYVFNALKYKDTLREYIEFEKWMIDNKLLHRDFLTMKDQELFTGYNTGTFPLMREQFTMPYGAVPSSMNPNNDPTVEIAPIYPFDINGKKYTQPKSVHYNIGYRAPMVVSNKSEAKDEIMAAMDYMYSPEGIEFNFVGIEGETFERDATTPSGYRLINVQSVWTQNADGSFPADMKRLQDYGFKSWWVLGVVPTFERFATVNYKAGEEEQANVTLKQLDYMNKNGFLTDPDPAPIFSKEEREKISEVMTPINTYLEESISRFILGTKPMSEFDAFIAELEKYDTKTLLELYNSKIK